jgi:hypothetical protein
MQNPQAMQQAVMEDPDLMELVSKMSTLGTLLLVLCFSHSRNDDALSLKPRCMCTSTSGMGGGGGGGGGGDFGGLGGGGFSGFGGGNFGGAGAGAGSGSSDGSASGAENKDDCVYINSAGRLDEIVESGKAVVVDYFTTWCVAPPNAIPGDDGGFLSQCVCGCRHVCACAFGTTQVWPVQAHRSGVRRVGAPTPLRGYGRLRQGRWRRCARARAAARGPRVPYL